MKKIDSYESNKTIFPPYTLVIRAASFLCRTLERVKVIKKGKLPKPPYLFIVNHASFMDFFAAIKATLPHQPYWVSTIEEFIDKNHVFRYLGIIPKRKFTKDPRSAKLMMEVLKDRKKILIIYPEARYSFIGQPERIDKGIASIAKTCKVPIVYMQTHGHYLRDPQWGDHHIRKIRPIIDEVQCIVSKKYINELTTDEIFEVILDHMKFDEEQYQLDNHILNTYENRAVGIERILYKCPHCEDETSMSSFKTHFKCNKCGKEYEYKEDGTIACINGESKFKRVSEWYKYEKECVRDEVKNGLYYFEDEIRLEHLKGVGVGFKPLEGKYRLIQSLKDGIKVFDKDNNIVFERSPLQNFALHIEYDYKKRGGCVDLSTPTETYFAYPLNKYKILTKLHFATEIIYDISNENLKKGN